MGWDADGRSTPEKLRELGLEQQTALEFRAIAFVLVLCESVILSDHRERRISSRECCRIQLFCHKVQVSWAFA
jgi:hypothetical protein